MTFKIVLLLALLLFAYSGAGKCYALEIVSEGQPKAVIVVNADAPRMVNYAAIELQAYIEKISGAKLQIEKVSSKDSISLERRKNYIFVGESRYTKKLRLSVSTLGTDGFKIVAKKNYLALIGRDYKGQPMTGNNRVFSLDETYNSQTGISVYGETGTLYAVYHFLEKYAGVRWFMPGELGEVVPKSRTITIGDVNFKKAPDFTYRRLYFAYGFEEPKYLDMVRWYRRAGFGGDFPVEIMHSFQDFSKRYLKSHPEYFYNYGKAFPHLVLTEPAVLEQFIKDIRDYFDAHPDRRIYPVVPDDWELGKDAEKDIRLKGVDDPSMGKWGRFSDYLWSFIDKVAIEVYKTHPDKLIGCLAYADYRLPPKKIKRLNPNVVVMIAMDRFLTANPVYRKKVADLAKDWKKKTDNIYIWQYYNWFYGDLALPGAPVIFPHLIANDLKFLKGISKGEFIEAETMRPPLSVGYPGLTHLNYYITAKYLWNADEDIEELLNDYFEKFYGPAREEMKKFFARAEDIWTKTIENTRFDKSPYPKYYHLSEEEMGELLGFLKRAREKAGDTLYGKRVDLILSEVLHVEKGKIN